MYCPQCRGTYDENAKYCHQCGHVLPTSNSTDPAASKLEGSNLSSTLDSPRIVMKPYPWSSVLKWMGGGFVAGILLVHAPHSSSLANTVALKIVGGITWAILLGGVVGIYKLFKRN